ncbi:phBC6A51 family helix-turn-helix protein [Bacillus subtilis]|uniref:phBC6A51 family helix-turn-helix protein n=1 Tax=Bacillus subtilis TaxID=1423 RepID=UPI0026758FDE|nr:phBC6A51 family helix-turn-helix protein [Bacillus subtilis]MDO3653548.1 phBC6A51 family helix-turn-helix protein [Bacillus subtilis]
MKKDAVLNEKQIRILEDYFVRTLAGETMEQIATDNGISRKTLSQWKNTDMGKRLYADYMKEVSVNDIPLFYQKLSEGVAKNSFKHMELFAKIHGLLAPEKKEVVTESKHPSDNVISKERLDEIRKRLEKTIADAESPTIKRVK